MLISRHRPVMAAEAAGLLALPPGGVAWDLTAGDGGHAEALLTGWDGTVVAMDRDPEAVAAARERLAPFGGRVRVVHGRFGDVGRRAREGGWPAPDGILMDVGTSARQLQDPARGFSFARDGPLDMRMDPGGDGPTAAGLVNTLGEAVLADLFHELGQERWSRRIARALVERRRRRPFGRTGDLAGAVQAAVPVRGRIHPATRVFQALRIRVNDELGELSRGLECASGSLRPGGRLAVISFHSLEDGIVKRDFLARRAAGGWRVLTRKPVRPSADEIRDNPRSRSARLRALQREAA